MENQELQVVETVAEKGTGLMTKQNLIIVGGVILIAAIGYGVYKFIRSKKETSVTVTRIEELSNDEENEE